MTDRASRFSASKSESSLIVLFIPSVDRDGQYINQRLWVHHALELLGNTFGGATAHPPAQGVWRDDDRGGKLVRDETVVIECYSNEAAIEQHTATLRDFLMRMGSETNQGAVGFVIDQDYLEIRFRQGGG